MLLNFKIIGIVILTVVLLGSAVFVYFKISVKPCQEDWVCGLWSECIDNIKNRSCVDRNNCATVKNKPIESDSCDNPVSLCGNGICDQEESCQLCQDDCGKCDGEKCEKDDKCFSKHCVHDICRPNSFYCGDNYCDTGEACSSCAKDCGVCPSLCSNNKLDPDETCDPPAAQNPSNQCQVCSAKCEDWINKSFCTTCNGTPYCSGINKCGEVGGDTKRYDFRCDGLGNCVAKSNEICRCGADDSDNGSSYTIQGTCRQYDGCSEGNCINSQYTDTCVDATKLKEYYISSSGDTATCASKNYDCLNLGTDYACLNGECIPPNCSCLSWSNAGCDQNSCSSNQMKQTRSCTPVGCTTDSQCLGPNYGSWINQGCGVSCGSAGTCSATQQCQKRVDSHGCAPDQYQCVIDPECRTTLKTSIDNTLEYMMQNSQLYLKNPFDVSLWVTSKTFLGTSINNKQDLINYLNSKQEFDGAWSGSWRKMFTTQRVLLTYYQLNATPAKSLDTFFSGYDTWAEAKDYMLTTGSGDARNMYHLLISWATYYWGYPPWMNDFFNEAEKDLSWTSNSDFHKRTHILYSYIIADRQFPNLDGIINATISAQLPDGRWDGSWYNFYSTHGDIYFAGIQISLLNQILKLYPGHRTAEIQASLEKAKAWVNSVYHTQALDGKVCGYFGNAMNLEHGIFDGILSAGQTGVIPANIDMSMEDLVDRIQKPKSHSYIMDMPVYPTDTVPKPFQGYSEVVFGWFPWSHGICYDENGKFLRYHMSLTQNWIYFTVLVNGSEYRFDFDTKNYNYTNGVLTLTNGSTKLIIDYHIPHNVTLLYGSGYLTFTATYRGAPLWYSKTLELNDMLVAPELNGRFGGYDAPISISGKIFDGTTTKNFNGYGDWEHVWFLGGGWSGPRRLWLIFNNDKYYVAIAELKYPDGTVAWHVGRLGEVGGQAYVFDDFEWIDDGKALPSYVELKGPIKDVQGNVKGYVDLKTDPQKATSVSSIWMLYENISGNILGEAFVNGTAWAEIRK